MRPLLAALMIALPTSPALADWQYTRWGMTPDEVQVAAKGRLKENLNPGHDVDDEEAKLKGAYRAQSISFEAYFQFRGDRLSGVSLNAEEGSCFTLHNNLRYTYGTGQRQDVADVIETERWKDEPSGNNVQYTKIGGTSCSVRYTPLTRANEPGGL